MLEGQKYTFDILARDTMQNNRSFWYHFGKWFAGHISLIHLLGCSIDPIDGILVVQVGVHSMKGIIFVAQMLKRQKAHYQLSTNPSVSKGAGFIHINLTKLTCSDIPHMSYMYVNIHSYSLHWFHIPQVLLDSCWFT